MAPTIRRREDMELGPLHALLIKACPPHSLDANGKLVPDPNGVKSIAILAHTLGLSPWSLMKWVHKGKIPPERVMKIVDGNPSEVSIAQFSPFVYGLGS